MQSEPIHVMDMEDGEVGIIVNWSVKSYLGKIVQRHGEKLISLGMTHGHSWPNIFGKYPLNKKEYPECQVQLGKVEIV